MSVANFSVPSYQPVVVAAPSFYAGHNPNLNSFQINAILPPDSEPNYEDEESFRNSPYSAYYQQQQRQQQGKQRSAQQHQTSRNGNDFQDSALSYKAQNLADYEENVRKTLAQEKALEESLLLTRVSQTQDNPQETSTQAAGEKYPQRPAGYAQVSSGTGLKTSVHAIVDYDDDNEGLSDYYDEDMPQNPQVTPIQGPISIRNGTVPVVPLYSYPQLNNGTLVQIPILWTALSVALGVELRGDLVRGAPCIKKNYQLYCPTAGSAYPLDKIELFIDENKALVKRMYGTFEMNQDPSSRRRRRMAANDDLPDGGPKLGDNPGTHPRADAGESFFNKIRKPRQSTADFNVNKETGRTDSCESKIEVLTPFWADNSAGKKRAIVNTQHFEQAIHQEVCTKPRTSRCTDDCGCEQKFKWHRLLSYDPDNDCKGIFMDWFLFPSCCVCRCDPKP